MKVKELIEGLKTHDPEAEVIVAENDANTFSPLCEVQEALYFPETTWGGVCFYGHEDDPEIMADVRDSYGEEDIKKAKAICLFPVH